MSVKKITSLKSDFSFPLSWFSLKGYGQGVFWVVMLVSCSVMNDVLMRILGERLHISEISFFRFFFSLVSVLPLMFYKQNINLLKTNVLGLHLIRGIIGAVALALCCYSVNIMSLAENTTIMFTQPLCFLPLAYFFLKESVDKYRWFATIIGFCGILIIMEPGADTFKLAALVPLSAAFLFAIISVLAKKMIHNEHTLTLLFYFGLVTTLFSFPIMLFFWQTPSFKEIALLALLGVGANIIQLCLFKAFSVTQASALTPIFYIEIIIASLCGYLFFGQIPTTLFFVGAFFIIGSTFMISYIETQKQKN